MSDPTTDVIVATGGTAVVRAAYRSGNPAWGVGPGNVPALVDHTADLGAAARRLMDSKSFDNSILCTNESCVIVEERVADAFQKELGRHGGHVLEPEDVAAVREAVYPEGRMRVELVGKDAQTLARGGRDPVARRCRGAGGALLARRARGAAGAGEALPAARARPRAGRAPRNRRRPRDAADRRRRPLGDDPLARSANGHGLRGRRPGPARGRQRGRQHRARPASGRTWRRR